MAKTKHIPDQKIIAVFDTMIAGVPGVMRQGAQMPYVSINGDMYASISKANRIGVRLSKADLAKFLASYAGGLHEALPGFFQPEYIAVPPSLYADPETLQAWFRRSHAHASRLKPKPTKKPRP